MPLAPFHPHCYATHFQKRNLVCILTVQIVTVNLAEWAFIHVCAQRVPGFTIHFWHSEAILSPVDVKSLSPGPGLGNGPICPRGQAAYVVINPRLQE